KHIVRGWRDGILAGKDALASTQLGSCDPGWSGDPGVACVSCRRPQPEPQSDSAGVSATVAATGGTADVERRRGEEPRQDGCDREGGIQLLRLLLDSCSGQGGRHVDRV